MVGVFEEYTDRITSHANNLRGRYEADTQSFIHENFDDAPTFRRIDVYRQSEHLGEFGVRVNMIERMGNIRNILLRPGENLDVGNMATFEDRTWLLFDKYGYKESGVKLTAMRTNHNLQWIDEDNVLHAKRCYASSSDIGSKSKQSRAQIEYNKYDVKLPYGQLYIFIETTEYTENIKLNQRFIINKIPYEVVGVDNMTHVEDGYGVIQYTVKRVTAHNKDDFELGIAYNSYIDYEEIEGDEDIPTGEEPISNVQSLVSENKAKEDKDKDSERGGSIW